MLHCAAVEFSNNTGYWIIYLGGNPTTLEIPPYLSCWLVDRHLGKSIDLRADSQYHFAFVPCGMVDSEADTRFVLVVGDADYITENVPKSATGPIRTDLHPNAPNPFHGSTLVRYDLATRQNVCLRVYDTRGALVAELTNQIQGPGRHEFIWDGKNLFGRPVASGVYFLKLSTPTVIKTRKALLVK